MRWRLVGGGVFRNMNLKLGMFRRCMFQMHSPRRGNLCLGCLGLHETFTMRYSKNVEVMKTIIWYNVCTFPFLNHKWKIPNPNLFIILRVLSKWFLYVKGSPRKWLCFLRKWNHVLKNCFCFVMWGPFLGTKVSKKCFFLEQICWTIP